MDTIDFILSVITPIYNAEEFLEETIECVINQTIGFEENIQLILINDGSLDDSGLICEKYKNLYPNNIIYIEKKNEGVSSARNEGLKHIQGKYTIFLDSDDFWSENSFEEIVRFFEEHYDEVDVCSCKMCYIGDFSYKNHPLDYKYRKGARVVDLREFPTYICTTIGNSAFKSECLSGRSFDESMHYCEDSLFQNQLIDNKFKIGILPDAVFSYRKGGTSNNASLNVTKTEAWYFEIIEKYYLRLLKFAQRQHGFVPRFFQETVFYDIKWRSYNPAVVALLSEEQKEKHLELLRKTLTYIDDDIILKAKGIDRYKKLYFLDIKYNKSLIKESVLVGKKLFYQDQFIFSLWNGSLLEIRSITIKDDCLIIEGLSRLNYFERPFSLYAMDLTNMENRIPVSTTSYPKWDRKGVVGEIIIACDTFKTIIPIRKKCRICFCVDIDGQEVKLKPNLSAKNGWGMTKEYNNSYCTIGKYLLKYKNGVIGVYNNRFKTRVASEVRYLKEVYQQRDKTSFHNFYAERAENGIYSQLPLKNRVAFISIRSDDKLLGNMQKVYDQLDLPKVKYTKLHLGEYPECIKTARKIASTSKIVITDDYLFLLKEKKKGQKYIQLWHATGAGKYFGQDGTAIFPGEDALYHRNYDLVTVSAEKVRDVYSSAFAIPTDKIMATGVARTDDYFDKALISDIRANIFSAYPDLKEKEIILYSPTFRDIPGVHRSIFNPKLDFDQLSEVLGPNQVFVIRPHPVMTASILSNSYDNILEIRDISTNNLMFVSSMMITDYSSTMFEYSLLRKPMAFFCYDYDEYDRGFYMDFDTELPGPLLRNQEELFEYIRKDEHPLDEKFEAFYDKYMSACDGHSTERIVQMIKDMFYGKE